MNRQMKPQHKGHSTRQIISMMFHAPFLAITCLVLALLALSAALLILWLGWGIALVHPAGPLVGIVGSLSALAVLYFAMRAL